MLGKHVSTGGEGDSFGRLVGQLEKRLGELERAVGKGLRPWNMPWGIIGYAARTSNQSSITTETDIGDGALTITWTAVANRRYSTTVWVAVNNVSGAAGDTIDVKITDGANAAKQVFSGSFASGTGWLTGIVQVVETVAAGSTTRKGRIAKTIGGGSVTVTASSTRPAFILVEDIGSNGAPV